MNVIIGTDEAGRGPLAGPVYAAAVALPDDFPFEILNDSKKMTEKARERAELIIKEKALAWAVASIGPEEIDQINILNAALKAMTISCEEVANKLKEQNITEVKVLADGNRMPPVSLPCETVVKGDSKIHQIMAASILAKTGRDRYMLQAAEKWPQYGFEKHKGYPVASHYKAIEEYGPCPIHRLTFKGVCQR
jgi:ribonuclease HII